MIFSQFMRLEPLIPDLRPLHSAHSKVCQQPSPLSVQSLFRLYFISKYPNIFVKRKLMHAFTVHAMPKMQLSSPKTVTSWHQ